MAFTEQERALEQVQAKYGKTGFAIEHLNYRMVSYKRGDKTISAIGKTWEEGEGVRINPKLEPYRILNTDWGSQPGDDFGAFRIPGPQGEKLMIIASPGNANEGIPWEHVSVSCKNRCPRWDEMCFVKSLFWDDEESVMQLHPPKSTWINNHPYCLHLWKPASGQIPLPPSIAVGLQALNGLHVVAKRST